MITAGQRTHPQQRLVRRVEREAIAILKPERRPTVETIHNERGGSVHTTGDALRHLWRDLGTRIGDPAARTWQRALKLAGEAAINDDNAARERTRQPEVAQYGQQIVSLMAGAIAEKRPAQGRRGQQSAKPNLRPSYPYVC